MTVNFLSSLTWIFSLLSSRLDFCFRLTFQFLTRLTSHENIARWSFLWNLLQVTGSIRVTSLVVTLNGVSRQIISLYIPSLLFGLSLKNTSLFFLDNALWNLGLLYNFLQLLIFCPVISLGILVGLCISKNASLQSFLNLLVM